MFHPSVEDTIGKVGTRVEDTIYPFLLIGGKDKWRMKGKTVDIIGGERRVGSPLTKVIFLNQS